MIKILLLSDLGFFPCVLTLKKRILSLMVQKGWICLDIDGTITLDKYSVPQEVTDFLRELQNGGWRLAMATGRPFAFALTALSHFDFPFFFLPQNGSAVFEMPAKRLLFKKYLSQEVIALVEQAYDGIDSDFLVYAGYEKGDFCYYRPQRFSEVDLQYLEDLKQRQKENWKEVHSFEIASFPLIKCFGHPVRMRKVAERLRAYGCFEVAKIRDPFDAQREVLLVTDKGVSKGLSLLRVFAEEGRGDKVIAAGDDENDVSLLEIADVKIAMSHAPEPLLAMADFIAPPTRELGILRALKMALSHV